MTDEGGHDITGIQHGGIQTGIDGRCTGFFLAGSYQQGIFVLGSLVVFRKRNMEESHCRQGLSTVARSKCCTFLTVPFYLICLYPVISFNLFQWGIGVAVKNIKYGCFGISSGSLNRQDEIADSGNAFGPGVQASVFLFYIFR